MSETQKRELTAERLRELFRYDPATGVFTRRISTSNRVKAGETVGTPDGAGYLRVMVDDHNYRLHRLAWLYVHGRWPAQRCDHKNGLRHDNRIDNLRDVTPSVNNENARAARSNNLLGLLGVSRNARGRPYKARIKVKGAVVLLGNFDDPVAAHAAYVDAKRALHEGNML
jgi:hypothetical protein